MTDHIYPYVAILGIDGMGNFDTKTDTPNIDELIKNGCVNHFALSEDPTISAENWAAMLFGTSPRVHQKTNGYIAAFEHTDKNLPSLFSRVRKAYPDAYLASAVNWNPINHGIVEHDINVELTTAENDGLLTDDIVEIVKKKPKLLFVQFDEVDGAGHSHTYGSREHLRQIVITDGYIGKITNAYKQAGIFDDTLFIVLADHGGFNKSHGGYTDGEKYITFAVSGKTVSKGKMGDASARDVCATALCALGLEVPKYDEFGFSSRVPSGVFEGIPGYSRPQEKEYTGTTAETPAFDGKNGLRNIFGDKIKLAMFFDNSLTDETGNHNFEENGTVKYYSDGVYGSRGEFGLTGSASANATDIGKNSFSVCVWLFVDKKTINGKFRICGNLSCGRQDESGNGFSLSVKNSDTEFSVSVGNEDFTLVTPFPEDFAGGRLHVICVFDRENKKIDVCMNFKHVCSFNIPDGLAADLSAPVFTVGNDTANICNTEIHPNTFNIDDLLIFDGALTDEDTEKLRTYYNG